jgi:hypothetical protein
MPVSDNLDSHFLFRPERRQFFEGIVRTVEERGIKVLCAGTNEQWGAVRLKPVEFTKYDLDSLLACDILVVVTNERLNRDMYLETGIAVARGIPIFFFVPASTKLTYMGLGMEELGIIKVFRYDSDAEVEDLVRVALGDLSVSAPA